MVFAKRQQDKSRTSLQPPTDESSDPEDITRKKSQTIVLILAALNFFKGVKIPNLKIRFLMPGILRLASKNNIGPRLWILPDSK